MCFIVCCKDFFFPEHPFALQHVSTAQNEFLSVLLSSAIESNGSSSVSADACALSIVAAFLSFTDGLLGNV